MNGWFDYFLVRRGEVFFDCLVKRIVRELPKSLLLIEVGAPNDYCTAFVGRFDSNVFAFTKVQKCGPFIGFDHFIGFVLCLLDLPGNSSKLSPKKG